MSQQRKVKLYLEEHKISALFEDLMTRLMQSLPNDPIIYVVHVLERKIERRKQMMGEGVRKSTGNLTGAEVGDDVSAWAISGSGGIVSKDPRTYDKPWSVNTKPKSSLKSEPTPSRSRSAKADKSPARKSAGKVAWNPDTKVPSGDFDELWRAKQDEEKTTTQLRQSQPQTLPRKPTRSASKDLELTFTGHGYSGPRRPRPADDLDDEFSAPKITKQQKPAEILDHKMMRCGKRRSKPSSNKLHIIELVEAERREPGPEVEVDIDDQEDGVEVYEDEDELRSEGVAVKPSQGPRVRHSVQADKGPVVRVSICGRCARVMTAGSEPVSRRAGTVTDSPTYDIRSSAQLTQNAEDDEFESVSQVSGPRRPVWIDDESVPSAHKGRAGARGEDSSPDLEEKADQSPSPPTDSWDEGSPPDADQEQMSSESPDVLAGARPWSTAVDSDVSDLNWASERVRRARIHAKNNGQY